MIHVHGTCVYDRESPTVRWMGYLSGKKKKFFWLQNVYSGELLYFTRKPFAPAPHSPDIPLAVFLRAQQMHEALTKKLRKLK